MLTDRLISRLVGEVKTQERKPSLFYCKLLDTRGLTAVQNGTESCPLSRVSSVVCASYK